VVNGDHTHLPDIGQWTSRKMARTKIESVTNAVHWTDNNYNLICIAPVCAKKTRVVLERKTILRHFNFVASL